VAPLKRLGQLAGGVCGDPPPLPPDPTPATEHPLFPALPAAPFPDTFTLVIPAGAVKVPEELNVSVPPGARLTPPKTPALLIPIGIVIYSFKNHPVAMYFVFSPYTALPLCA
jgi:hypothetical protein